MSEVKALEVSGQLHYIDGSFVGSVSGDTFDVINPATEDVCGRISLGSPEDVDKAVAAAKKALPAFSQTSIEERIELLEEILARFPDYEVLSDESVWPATEFVQGYSHFPIAFRA